MAVTPAILLAKLQGLSISTDVIKHPPVMTVEVHIALAQLMHFRTCVMERLQCTLYAAGSKQVHRRRPWSGCQKLVSEGRQLEYYM